MRTKTDMWWCIIPTACAMCTVHGMCNWLTNSISQPQLYCWYSTSVKTSLCCVVVHNTHSMCYRAHVQPDVYEKHESATTLLLV
jgi:hypothetical protein